MYAYELTIGLFDKITEVQEVSTLHAEQIIGDTLINKYELFAYTLIHCKGCYKMDSTGNIISEPSIRLEIASETQIDDKIYNIIQDLKIALNQESIMYKKQVSEIEFI